MSLDPRGHRGLRAGRRTRTIHHVAAGRSRRHSGRCHTATARHATASAAPAPKSSIERPPRGMSLYGDRWPALARVVVWRWWRRRPSHGF